MADFQIWEKPEKTSININDILAINNSEDSNKFRSLKIGTLIAASVAIGEYKPFDSDHPALVGLTLPDGVVKADGRLISDPDSIYNGYRIRNLNGALITFNTTWTANPGGSYATISAANLPALNVGDEVTGSGIGLVNGQNARIIGITGTTVKISYVSASGTISTTYGGRGTFLRGGSVSGVSKDDAMQGHWHEAWAAGTGGTEGALLYTTTGGAPGPFVSNFSAVRDIITDGFNGAPRVAPETRPKEISMIYLTRIK